ncbi:hypothetical protein ACFXPT_38155 [Streptomyces goshikiensis]|uniref:SMODS domain-containing nucleotidyltransferase n=1 Tax=Streptomyces goshikiensis TaxID=1942 RepID=UPI0036C2182C
MATSTAAAFEEFDRILTPPPAMLRLIRQRCLEIAVTLSKDFPAGSDIEYRSTEVFGSTARSTAIMPIYDADLFVHLFVARGPWEEKYRSDSRALLQRVRDSLQSGFNLRPEHGGRAVTVSYGDGMNIDVCPGVKCDTGYQKIPEDSGNWMTNLSDGHIRHLNLHPRSARHELTKIIRFAKQWNRTEYSRLKSFHVELLASASFRPGEKSGSALESFFGFSRSSLSVPDPHNPGDQSRYLAWSERHAIRNRLEQARSHAITANFAEEHGDHSTAIGLWEEIMGEKFPSFSQPASGG